MESEKIELDNLERAVIIIALKESIKIVKNSDVKGREDTAKAIGKLIDKIRGAKAPSV